MSQYKRIFIVGQPGAGKGVLAKALAVKLGWEFINADLGLESSIGLSLGEIAGAQGEIAFLECAAKILAYQLGKENIVVATDACIGLSEQNRQLLAKECVVYLKVSTSLQLERLSHNPPPLLSVTDSKTFLDKLHRERDGLYEKMAKFSISSDDNAVEKHVLEIIKTIE